MSKIVQLADGTKTCCRCLNNFPSSIYSKSKTTSDRLFSYCPGCTKEYRCEYQKKNKEQIAKRASKRYAANKEKFSEISKLYRQLNPERMKKNWSKWYQANKQHRLLYQQEYVSKNADMILIKKENYKPRGSVVSAIYYQKNKDKIHLRNRKRAATDLQYRLSCGLRSRIAGALKRGPKNGSAIKDLGCSVEELRHHLESKFREGMSWDNWGAGEGCWHIDHIVPLAAFNLSDRQHFLLAGFYLNLQPLWAKENLSKGCKIPEINFE